MSNGADTTGVPVTPAPTPAVIINSEKPGGAADVLFHVQLAVTPAEHKSGLKGRPVLAADAGLLFVFPRPGIHTLSMKDNLIPLDLIFIGASRRIVGIIEEAPPRSPTAKRIAVASQFVLQIRAGLVSRHGFKIGQPVAFRAVPGV